MRIISKKIFVGGTRVFVGGTRVFVGGIRGLQGVFGQLSSAASVGMVVIILFSSLLYGQNNKEPDKSDRYFKIDYMMIKINKDIKKALEEKLFEGRVAIVGMTVYQGKLKNSTINYILNKMEEISYKKDNFEVIKSISALNKRITDKDGNILRFAINTPELMQPFAQEMGVPYFAFLQISKKKHLLTLTISIFETDTLDLAWSNKWSTFFSDRGFYYELGIFAVIDQFYFAGISNTFGINILNAIDVGIYVDLITSAVETTRTPSNHLIVGVNIGINLGFSLVKSFMDNNNTFDLLLGVRGGVIIGYIIQHGYVFTPDDSAFFQRINVTPGITFRILNNGYVFVGASLEGILLNQPPPLGVGIYISGGFRF